MSWFDQPKKWWVYKWTHHFWVLSFNRNPELYRVVWWSRYTRPMFYNNRGRIRGSLTLWAAFIYLGLIYGLGYLAILFDSVLGGL